MSEELLMAECQIEDLEAHIDYVEEAARAFAKALNEAADGWPRPNRYDDVLKRYPGFLPNG